MSTELFIQGYSRTGEDGILTGEVLRLFRVTAPPDSFGFFPLEYDDQNSCDLFVKDSDGKAIGITIMRPCEHQQFWLDIFALLECGPYVAFMPGSPAPVVVNPEVASHLPEGMADALGKPQEVATAQELVSRILEA